MNWSAQRTKFSTHSCLYPGRCKLTNSCVYSSTIEHTRELRPEYEITTDLLLAGVLGHLQNNKFLVCSRQLFLFVILYRSNLFFIGAHFRFLSNYFLKLLVKLFKATVACRHVFVFRMDAFEWTRKWTRSTDLQ